MNITIADLKKGEQGIITDSSSKDIPLKLLEMGCLPGNTTNYLWDFGDGDYSSNYSTSHSYSSVDSFKISLRATSSYGCVSIKRKDIEVVGNPNVSMDTITGTEQCLDGNLFSVVRLKKSTRFEPLMMKASF